jgi:hypothetical protein
MRSTAKLTRITEDSRERRLSLHVSLFRNLRQIRRIDRRCSGAAREIFQELCRVLPESERSLRESFPEMHRYLRGSRISLPTGVREEQQELKDWVLRSRTLLSFVTDGPYCRMFTRFLGYLCSTIETVGWTYGEELQSTPRVRSDGA